MQRPEVHTLRTGFDRAVSALASVLDDEQEPVADRLALLGAQLHGSGRRRWGRDGGAPGRGFGRRAPSGVYLHGPVGRGKTWLVDVLLHQLPAVRP